MEEEVWIRKSMFCNEERVGVLTTQINFFDSSVDGNSPMLSAGV